MLTASADVAILSLHFRVGGVTPGHWRGVRVAAVVIVQALVGVPEMYISFKIFRNRNLKTKD